MKTIIAGGRDYIFSEADINRLDNIIEQITEVVSGCARGADTCGEKWAESHGIPVKKFPADWDRFGKSAGHRRNQQMAEYAQAVVLFPGGFGTADMAKRAKRMKLLVFDFRDGTFMF